MREIFKMTRVKFCHYEFFDSESTSIHETFPECVVLFNMRMLDEYAYAYIGRTAPSQARRDAISKVQRRFESWVIYVSC